MYTCFILYIIYSVLYPTIEMIQTLIRSSHATNPRRIDRSVRAALIRRMREEYPTCHGKCEIRSRRRERTLNDTVMNQRCVTCVARPKRRHRDTHCFHNTIRHFGSIPASARSSPICNFSYLSRYLECDSRLRL